MTEEEFADFLKNNKVTVVHFSHHQLMTHDVEFPNDLIHAMKTFDVEVRACCAIFPDHKMDLPGSVGIIFDTELKDIHSVLNYDSGSSEYGSLGLPPNETSLPDSINVSAGTYNEWVIRGAKPKAIFISDINNIEVKMAQKFMQYGQEHLIFGTVAITVQDVKDIFPSLQVFTMDKEGLVAL